MNGKLLVHPYPQPGQSVECYIRQLAVMNGYQSDYAMLRQMVSESGQFTDKISLKQLELLTGHDPNILGEAQLTLVENNGCPAFRFHDVVLPSYHLRRDEWVCPHCYVKTGYMSATWRIAWLPMCTKHKCALEQYDPVEESQSKIEKQDIFFLHAANDESVPSDILEVQMLLEGKLREEAMGQNREEENLSIVSLIDTHLLRALKLSDVAQLQNRKRRYALKYFPLGYEDTLKFMSCLHVQLLD